MKELVAKLMNHGFSESQAKEFIRECYDEFVILISKRLGIEINAKLAK